MLVFSLAFGASLYAQTPELSPELVLQLNKWRENLTEYQAWKNEAEKLKKNLAERQQYKDILLNAFDSLADKEERQSPQIDSLARVKRFLEKKSKPYRDNVVFKVQIAVYRQHPIDGYLRKGAFLHLDSSEKDRQKYLLGSFRSYQEAKKLSAWLNKMGASSYVVAYQNNRRLNSLGSYAE